MSATPFPFIVGCPRSGTTLLRAMLGSHPDLSIPMESYFIADLAPEFAPRRFRRFSWEKLLAALSSHDRFVRWDLPQGHLIAAFEREQPRTYADALRLLYATYAELEGKPRYGDKTPAYVLDIEILAKLFPEGCFVHVIRDGRDVALSLLEIEEWGPDDMTKAARYWGRYVSAGRSAGAALGGARYREVRYERLVHEPQVVLREICAFLDLGYDERMLDYPSRAEVLKKGMVMPETHTGLGLPPTEGLRSWRDQMSGPDQETFLIEARALITELGYEPYASAPNESDGEKG